MSENDNIAVSVAVATYNVEKYISRCLDSFCDNRFKGKLEVLIINDGSTDSSVRIAEEYVDRFPEIFRIVNKENGGWGSTINSGADSARGKYFYQLDGDDYCDTTAMLELVSVLEKENADLVLTNWKSFIDGNEKDETLVKYLKEESAGLYEEIFCNNTFPSIHSLCVKTELLKKISIQEKCFYTDVEYVFKTALMSKTYHYVPIYVYCYRLGRSGQSVSFSGIKKHYKDHMRVVFECLQSVNVAKNKSIANGLIDYISKVAANQYAMFMICPTNRQVWIELNDYSQKIFETYKLAIDKKHKALALCCKNYLGYIIISNIYKKTKKVD